MIRLLLIIFFFFLFILLLVGASAIRTFFRLIFGSGNSRNQQPRQNQGNRNTYSEPRQEPQTRKKIFPADEGEYVDYEEVENNK